MADIVGTDGKDIITDTKVSAGVTGGLTTNDVDTVTARLGNDLVQAAGGDDVVYGDLNDVLQPVGGGPAPVGGNDRLYGDDGNVMASRATPPTFSAAPMAATTGSMAARAMTASTATPALGLDRRLGQRRRQ